MSGRTAVRKGSIATQRSLGTIQENPERIRVSGGAAPYELNRRVLVPCRLRIGSENRNGGCAGDVTQGWGRSQDKGKSRRTVYVGEEAEKKNKEKRSDEHDGGILGRSQQ